MASNYRLNPTVGPVTTLAADAGVAPAGFGRTDNGRVMTDKTMLQGRVALVTSGSRCRDRCRTHVVSGGA